jgi:hypothetical protein
VFLDPDTGLEPQNPSLDHVLGVEARAIWSAMKTGDVFAFYQHQTNRAGQPWIQPKQLQLAQTLGIPQQAIKIAMAPAVAQDVVFLYAQRT